MTKKRGLGRGLGSLIPSTETGESQPGGLLTVPVTDIHPNPHQPRGAVDEAGLAELAGSIREHGVIQPLVVNQTGDGTYTLIAGERRWRAARLAGLEAVPVVVKEASSQDMLELALVENIQRADLNALEEAHAYRQLIDDFGLTQEEVAQRVGKSRPTVANMLRLLNLPANIQAAIVDGRISGAHARALLPLPTPEAQTAVMNSIVKQGLSVRQVEAIVKKMLSGEKPKARAPKELPAELAALESDFRQSLGTRVNIQKGAKGGRVVIHFYSDEELQAIYEAIVGPG
jgi:ParB family chromosome partitioning protein